MDCDCIAKRDGQQAHGQRDAKLHSHGHHAHLLGNPVLDCHRQSAASTRKQRSLSVDDALGTSGICDRRLLPLSVLHHHWVEVWAAVHDSGTHHRRHHGVGHAGTVDQAHGHHSHARHPHYAATTRIVSHSSCHSMACCLPLAPQCAREWDWCSAR